MTTRRMRGFSPGDVVIVPFPFTDRETSRRRPALVCSSSDFNDQSAHAVLAMITTAAHSAWPSDVPITDLSDSGLPAASVVRWKLFTLDASFIIRRAGSLSQRDRVACGQSHPIGL